MAKFEIKPPVAIADVPVQTRSRSNQYALVYIQLGDIKRGQALPIKFETPKAALAARAALKKIAKAEGDELGGGARRTAARFISGLSRSSRRVSPPRCR